MNNKMSQFTVMNIMIDIMTLFNDFFIMNDIVNNIVNDKDHFFMNDIVNNKMGQNIVNKNFCS